MSKKICQELLRVDKSTCVSFHLLTIPFLLKMFTIRVGVRVIIPNLAVLAMWLKVMSVVLKQDFFEKI